MQAFFLLHSGLASSNAHKDASLNAAHMLYGLLELEKQSQIGV